MVPGGGIRDVSMDALRARVTSVLRRLAYQMRPKEPAELAAVAIREHVLRQEAQEEAERGTLAAASRRLRGER